MCLTWGGCWVRTEDQAKIRMAVGLRRVDPADVPASAKAKPAPGAGTSSQKRKAEDQPVAGPSRTQGGAGAGAAAKTRVIQLDDDIEEIVPVEEEAKDELYTTLRTNVVGIQYYAGV